MAYGDTTLDEILRQLSASQGAPNRPRFPITQTSSVLPNVAQAPAAPAQPASRAYRAGRLLGRGARALNLPALPLGTMGFGMADIAAATESGATRENRPERALQILSGADITGLGGALGRLLTGRPAYPSSGIEGPATQASRARGVVSAAPQLQSRVAFGGADVEDATLGIPQDFTPIRTDLDAEQMLRENYAPQRGTGAIRLGSGPARVIDTRGRPAEVAPAAPASTGNFAGDFTGALLNLKQVSGDNARRAAQARADAAALAARGTAARGAAALQMSELSARFAAEHLRANPGDIAGAAAILHGRSQGAGDNVFFPGIGPNDPTIVGSKRTGAVIARRPKVEAQMGKDAKGVWQILGPDGRALRPATPDEIEQRKAGR